MPPRLRGGAWGHPGNVQARGLNPAQPSDQRYAAGFVKVPRWHGYLDPEAVKRLAGSRAENGVRLRTSATCPRILWQPAQSAADEPQNSPRYGCGWHWFHGGITLSWSSLCWQAAATEAIPLSKTGPLRSRRLHRVRTLVRGFLFRPLVGLLQIFAG